MSDIDQAALLELLAGKTRSNTLAAILGNTEDLEDAYESAMNAEGSALAENEKYLDSIQGRIDLLTNSIQTMWNDTLDSDVVKFFVNIGTQLIKLIDGFGLIKTLVMAIGTLLIKKYWNGNLLNGLFGENISDMKSRLQVLKDGYEKAVNDFGGDSKQANKARSRYEKYNTKVSPYIKEYDELSQKLKSLEAEGTALQNTLNNTKSPKKIEEINAKLEENQKQIKDTKGKLQEVKDKANEAGTAGLTAGQKIETGFKSAAKAVWKFSKEILQSMAYTMAITAIFEALGNIWDGLAPLFDSIKETPEELQKELSELQNELSTVESELDSLNSKIESTNERIEELMSQGSLTFVEQEELNKLKSVSSQLEAQIKLQETLRQSLQQSTNSASIEATNAYLDTSFMSDKSKTERQEEAKEMGSGIGQIAGTIIGGIVGTVIGGGITLASGGTAAVPGAAIGIAAGSAIIGWLGGEGFSAVAGASYDSEESVGEAMDNMIAKRKELKAVQDEALANKDVEAYNEATEALTTYDTQMAKHISQIQANYNAMDWETATDEQKKAMIEYADWLDKYNISMGADGAKSNAISRIFGDEAQGNIATARDEINQLKKNLTEAKKNGKGVDEALAALEGFKLNLSEEEIERLREMGIYLYEVEDYFKEVIETESEFVDMGLEDVAKDINKITDGLESLKTAFDEVIEEGVLTAKTMMSIKETLGIGNISEEIEGADELTSAWTSYLETMMSGTATTEQMVAATEQLTQAWLEYQLQTPDGLTPETKYEYIVQLKVLGVENAEEYVEDLLQKNMVKEIEETVNLDAYLDHRYRSSDEAIAQVEKIAEKYGVEEDAINAIINKLHEKQEIENDIDGIKKQQKAYNNWYNITGDKKGFGALDEELKDYQQIIDEYNNFSEEAKKIGNPNEWTHYTARGSDVYYRYTDGSSVEQMDADDFRKNKEEAERYAEWLEQNSEKYQEYLVIKEQYDKALQEGIANGWVDENGNIIDQKFAEQIDGLNDQLETKEKEIEKELTADIQLKLELQDKSQLVDDIQSIYDTLNNAINEYNEHYHFSIDTFQSLVKLGPQYIALLYDENGQLRLNKATIEKVTRARMHDLAVQQIQNTLQIATNAVIDGNIQKLNELTDSLYNVSDAELAFDATTLMGGFKEALANSSLSEEERRKYIDAFTSWIEKVQDYYDQTKLELPEINNDIDLDSVSSAYSTLSDAVKQYNKTNYLTLDNLQALLSLEPEYLAALQMENGQLSINQAVMEAVVQAKLAEAKATVVDNAIKQLNVLTTQAEKEATEGHTEAMSGSLSVLGEYATGLSDVSKEALIATGSLSLLAGVTNGAIAAGVDPEKIQAVFDGMQASFAMINSVSANIGSHFKNIVSPGDSGAGESALEALQKRYERKIKNLENQQTQIENEIEILEAKGEGVSADYYEKQIELENEKIDLYQQEREELLKLERTDEVADAIWEVEHAIQESTLRTIEFRKAIAELYDTASQEISDAYGDKKQLFDDRKSYIENEISIRETKGELTPTSVYDELIEQETQNRIDAEAELNNLSDLYWQGINNGELDPDSQEAIDLLAKIRQKKLEIQESDKTIAEYAEQQKDAYIAYYDKMMEAYSHRNNFFQSQSDYAQSYIDRLDVLNINVPDEAYTKLAEIQELSNEGLKEQLAFARGELEDFELQGIDKNDSRYIEKFNEVLDLEQQVYEGETKTLEYHQKIIDNHIDRFNQVIDRINHAINQLENISSLVSNEDVANEDGSWTVEGLTQAGMLYQQMEYNKQVAADYAEEMKYLKEQLDKGEISEKEYTEKLQELQNGQWDAIKAYKSSEDAIVDLNEARIDMIEEGINKEIEAYQELIDLKKEELNSERDLYNFRKDIQRQTKDIASLERRIASMSGSSDTSTIAERTKLEAELREAREGLDDTYYNHGMDSQSQAFDDELEAYEKSANNYIESLRESIKDTKLVVEQTFTDVLANADIVLSEINRLSDEYGLTIDEHLKNPWINAAAQAETFKNTTDSSIRSLINEDGVITVFGSEETKAKLSGVFGAGSTAASNFAIDVGTHMNAVQSTVNSYTSPEQANYLGSKLKYPWEDAESAPSTWGKKSKEYMDGVVNHAEYNYKTQLEQTLDYPWEQANGYTSWGEGAKSTLQSVIDKANEAGKAIAGVGDTSTSDYTGSDSPSEGSGNTGSKSNGIKTGPEVKKLQQFLNYVFGAGLDVDGSYGPATKTAVKKAQEAINNIWPGSLPVDGLFGAKTKTMFTSYVNYMIDHYKQVGGASYYSQGIKQLQNANKISLVPMYAKGTMGTTRDSLAITDESWIGEEITLAAGKNGQLQYLKKGSAVMPADISANLVEWGKLNPNMMNMSNLGDGINLMSNYVNKPEVKFDIENLLRCDNVSQDTLPELKKFVSEQLDKFARQLNYGLRRVGAH